MTQKRFQEGETVVCIDEEMKPIREAGNYAPNLLYNNQYTILSYEYFKDGHWWLSVIGVTGGSFYTENTFAPVIQIEELIEEMYFIETV